jgi:mRNA interferase RelE/StbE
MDYDVILAPEAKEDLQRLLAYERSTVKAAMEAHLRHEPARLSKGRIKRLRGMRKPEYRLAVGEVRVFYDIADGRVHVLGIVHKPDAEEWLASIGEPQ